MNRGKQDVSRAGSILDFGLAEWIENETRRKGRVVSCWAAAGQSFGFWDLSHFVSF
jgi:hypothetical protein